MYANLKDNLLDSKLHRYYDVARVPEDEELEGSDDEELDESDEGGDGISLKEEATVLWWKEGYGNNSNSQKEGTYSLLRWWKGYRPLWDRTALEEQLIAETRRANETAGRERGLTRKVEHLEVEITFLKVDRAGLDARLEARIEQLLRDVAAARELRGVPATRADIATAFSTAHSAAASTIARLEERLEAGNRLAWRSYEQQALNQLDRIP